MCERVADLNIFVDFQNEDYSDTEVHHFHVHVFRISLMFVIQTEFRVVNVKDACRFYSFFVN